MGGQNVLVCMGRPRRVHYPGAVFHAMSRGNGGQLIFRSDDDCRIFLGILEDVVRRTRCAVLACCLMRNHFHLLVQVGDISLSVIMGRVLSRYAKYFNTRQKRRGHLFQSRFKAKLCADNAYLVTVLRYIHRNPVKDGLVASPGEWPWSSHNQYLGPIHSTLISVKRGLALLDSDPVVAKRRYALLMEEDDGGFEPRFDGDTKAPRKQPEAAPPKGLDEIAAGLRGESGVDFVKLPGTVRRLVVSRLRREFARRASDYGHSNTSIAKFLGVHPTSVGEYFNRPGMA